MIQLTTFFEQRNQELLEKKFLDDFHDECHNFGVGGYFGIMMIVTDDHLLPLILIARKYMHDILGLKIPDIPVIPFSENETRYLGAVGYYNQKTNDIHLQNNVHLHKLIPTVFHELTHAFIHNSGIVIVDDYEPPKTSCFDFAFLLQDGSQEEGFCELIMTLMQYHIFGIKEYPSKSEIYCLGWLLNMYTFMDLANIFRTMGSNKDNYEISRLSLRAMITFYEKNNNIYRFVNKVPKDAYHQERKIF